VSVLFDSCHVGMEQFASTPGPPSHYSHYGESRSHFSVNDISDRNLALLLLINSKLSVWSVQCFQNTLLDHAIANGGSVRLSVCLFVCHTSGHRLNGSGYQNPFCTTR